MFIMNKESDYKDFENEKKHAQQAKKRPPVENRYSGGFRVAGYKSKPKMIIDI